MRKPAASVTGEVHNRVYWCLLHKVEGVVTGLTEFIVFGMLYQGVCVKTDPITLAMKVALARDAEVEGTT